MSAKLDDHLAYHYFPLNSCYWFIKMHVSTNYFSNEKMLHFNTSCFLFRINIKTNTEKQSMLKTNVLIISTESVIIPTTNLLQGQPKSDSVSWRWKMNKTHGNNPLVCRKKIALVNRNLSHLYVSYYQCRNKDIFYQNLWTIR